MLPGVALLTDAAADLAEVAVELTVVGRWDHLVDHPVDEAKQLAAESVADLGNGQASASVPGTSGHDDPRRRREVVAAVFDDPRISGADHVTVAVPRGDTEALDEIRGRLVDDDTRSAGATVLVEGKPSSSGDAPGPTEDGSP
jgi:hypothetical protein